jgi:hypothetical protein
VLACQEIPGNPAVREGPSGPLPRMAPLHLVRPADLPGPAGLARRWHQEDLAHRPYQAALALHPTYHKLSKVSVLVYLLYEATVHPTCHKFSKDSVLVYLLYEATVWRTFSKCSPILSRNAGRPRSSRSSRPTGLQGGRRWRRWRWRWRRRHVDVIVGLDVLVNVWVDVLLDNSARMDDGLHLPR